MKLNKTLMIAGLIAGGVLTAAQAVRAQSATNQPAATQAHGARAAKAFEAMATKLELTDDQKSKVRAAIAERSQKLMALRKETDLDRAARQAKVKEIREETDSKLKEILTQQQYEQWQKMSVPRHRPAGAAGAPAPNATGATANQ